ncbi:hypothetical protein CR513_33797, partial [Mucuna pruriens]
MEEGFCRTVKLGNDTTMAVVAKGSIRVQINGITQVISDVYFVPELKNNLLSLGQLQEKGLAILIQNDTCKVFHPDKGLITHTNIRGNRMFYLIASAAPKDLMCLQVEVVLEKETQLWHYRFGHLNYNELNTLACKMMVIGLPSLRSPKKICTTCLIGKQQRGQLTVVYTPQQNGVAKRKNRTIMNAVRTVLNKRQVPKVFWSEVVRWCVHIQNKSSTLVVDQRIPEETWSGVKPRVDYFRIFGCVAHAHIPDQKRNKLDDKGKRCVFLRVSDESKAYKLFDPIAKKVIVSRDVVFEEDKSWDWKRTEEEYKVDVLDWEEKENSDDQEPTQNEEADNGDINQSASSSSSSEMGSSANEENDGEQEFLVEGRAARNRRKPVWMVDYEEETNLSEEEESLMAMMMAENGSDLHSFEEASKSMKWRETMNMEIKTIEKNKMWELTDAPKGVKHIGVKWIFKTKLNESGNIEKYKAKLVAKGYAQRYEVDYTEVFAPVARLDTVRVLLALAAQCGWEVFQLDVKSAFLHGKLKEEVFVQQSEGFVKKGKEDKVYKLKKALYDLK